MPGTRCRAGGERRRRRRRASQGPGRPRRRQAAATGTGRRRGRRAAGPGQGSRQGRGRRRPRTCCATLRLPRCSRVPPGLPFDPLAGRAAEAGSGPTAAAARGGMRRQARRAKRTRFAGRWSRRRATSACLRRARVAAAGTRCAKCRLRCCARARARRCCCCARSGVKCKPRPAGRKPNSRTWPLCRGTCSRRLRSRSSRKSGCWRTGNSCSATLIPCKIRRRMSWQRLSRPCSFCMPTNNGWPSRPTRRSRQRRTALLNRRSSSAHRTWSQRVFPSG